MVCSPHKIRVMPLTEWHHEPPTSVEDALKKRAGIAMEDVDDYAPRTFATLRALNAYIEAYGSADATKPLLASASIEIYVIIDKSGRVLCAKDNRVGAIDFAFHNQEWSMHTTRLVLS